MSPAEKISSSGNSRLPVSRMACTTWPSGYLRARASKSSCEMDGSCSATVGSGASVSSSERGAVEGLNARYWDVNFLVGFGEPFGDSGLLYSAPDERARVARVAPDVTGRIRNGGDGALTAEEDASAGTRDDRRELRLGSSMDGMSTNRTTGSDFRTGSDKMRSNCAALGETS